jgi:hypothetical protein
MGTYLNPGKAAFEEAVNSEIFIDKTEMLGYLNSLVKTKQKYVSVSRPRRFGKTMAADMLCAYYDREADSRALFEKRKLAQSADWDAYLGKFDVIRLVMTDFFSFGRTVEDALSTIKNRVLLELEESYPGTKYDANDFPYSLDRFYRKSGTPFVIVIDEWDAVFRIWKDNGEAQRLYLDFLRDWLKDKPYVALAYMTGILPIKKYGQHSALNMFTEYSMMAPRRLAPYTGFTEEEVQELCARYGRDYARVKDWYDGYVVSDIVPPDPNHEELKTTGKSPAANRYALYSPLSVVESMTTGVIKDYWNKTETYEALAEYIRKDYDGLKEAVALLMDGGRLAIDTSTYQNDMTTFTGRDDVLSLLIHLGYLGYDDERGEVFIPNREILDEFKTSTKGKEWVSTFKAFETSMELLRATWNCDEEKVAELVEDAHNQAGNRTYNDEAALSYGIQLAYYAARKYYTTILELDTGKGYADIVYLPAPQYSEKPALLIELKYGHSADAAMEQIRRRKYHDRLEYYRGNLLLIAINYNRELPAEHPEFKHHSCKIKKW